MKLMYIMIEEYKPIVDFENVEISNFGNVRNKKTNKILKPYITENGYYKVQMIKDKKNAIKNYTD